jgi:basic amino acid/polyamine antiporter, APA family
VAHTELLQSNAPFADAAKAMFGSWAGRVVALGAVIAAFGCLNGWILLQGQVPRAAAVDRLFPPMFKKTNAAGVPDRALVLSSTLATLLIAMNYTKSLTDQFNFVILLATLTTLIPYTYSAAAQLVLLRTDHTKVSKQRLAVHASVAALALLYSMWAIAGSGYQVVFRGFMLLLAGIPVYIAVTWKRPALTTKEPQ